VVSRLCEVIDEGLRLAKSGQKMPTFDSATLARGMVLAFHDPIIPAVAVLHAIIANVRSAQFSVARGQVRRWMDEYFAWYDKEYVPVNGPDESYRNNVVKEFDDLLKNLHAEDSDS
jgi:hypothetical protein